MRCPNQLHAGMIAGKQPPKRTPAPLRAPRRLGRRPLFQSSGVVQMATMAAVGGLVRVGSVCVGGGRGVGVPAMNTTATPKAPSKG